MYFFCGHAVCFVLKQARAVDTRIASGTSWLMVFYFVLSEINGMNRHWLWLRHLSLLQCYVEQMKRRIFLRITQKRHKDAGDSQVLKKYRQMPPRTLVTRRVSDLRKKTDEFALEVTKTPPLERSASAAHINVATNNGTVTASAAAGSVFINVGINNGLITVSQAVDVHINVDINNGTIRVENAMHVHINVTTNKGTVERPDSPKGGDAPTRKMPVCEDFNNL